jgi:hypothetical protein
MLQVDSVSDVPDDFFLDHPEGLDFHRAFSKARLDGFQTGCLLIRRDGVVISAVPYFVMRFAINTMMPEGRLKRWMSWATLRIACAGHPSEDRGRIWGENSAEALAHANQTLAKLAPVVCYKGFGPELPLPEFTKVVGLPIAVLQVLPDFWANLGSRRRSELKRKLKFSSPLRFEEQIGLPEELIDRVLELYLLTYERSPHKFERLNRAYFVETASISRYLLFFEDDLLIGFAQLLCGNGRMIHKYVGMDYERSRQYQLYFSLFLRAVDICIRDGRTVLECGATGYEFKRYLGSDMEPTWLYFRHNRWLVNAILKKLAFLLEPSEEELRR